MGVPLGNRPAVPRDWFRGVPERYAAGAYILGRPEGRPYPGSQQAIHETSGLSAEILRFETVAPEYLLQGLSFQPTFTG